MTIEDSVQRWQAYSKMFQKLVETFEDDIENDNVISELETVFMCSLHAVLVSAMHISEHALNIAQGIHQAILKEGENDNGIRKDN